MEGVAVMIKPWQKATLGLMAGAGVFAGTLSYFAGQTEAMNQAAAKARQTEANRQQLLKVIAVEQQNAKLLKASLTKIHAHTAGVNEKIRTVEQEIHQLRAGKLVNAASITTVSAGSVRTTTPQLISLPPTQAPAVQSVTKASGVK